MAAIYAAYEADSADGHRAHLGASVIGGDCDRAIWYGFRWASRVRHTGRLLRLFETGNLAEARFVADLRRIGVTVLDLDPNTGRQWTLRDATGHFGGSMDAVAIGLPEAPKTWHVCEFKTHSEKSFLALQKVGVAASKPAHWAQMQVYMHLAGLERAFYLAVNKNTDELYQERVHADAEAGLRLLAKAERIILAARPPARISEDPAWWQCRFCDHHAVCHGDAAPERHCLLPAQHARRRWPVALRAARPPPHTRRADGRLCVAPLHPRPGPRHADRCRRGLGQLPHA